jgi:hypothetical protein
MSQFTVTIPDSLHERAEECARDESVSLDVFVACAVAEKVAVVQAGKFLRECAARGNWEDFANVLAQVPDVAPEEFDRLSPEAAAAFEKLKQRCSRAKP